MQTGTIVVPQIVPLVDVPNTKYVTDEVIIGIVLRDSPVIGTYPGDYFDVLWLSERRGAFFWTEWHNDIAPASLDERNRLSGEKVDHFNLAFNVRRMIQENQPWVQG